MRYNIGTLVHWYFGIDVRSSLCWYIGIDVAQYGFGTLIHWYIGTLVLMSGSRCVSALVLMLSTIISTGIGVNVTQWSVSLSVFLFFVCA